MVSSSPDHALLLPRGVPPPSGVKGKNGSSSLPEFKFSPEARTAFYTIASFVVSMALVHITKWIYVEHHFKYPLWLTVSHMVTSYIMAVVLIFGFDWVPNRRRVSFYDQLFLIAPFSFLGAASIGCGNISLVHLYPSFHQMLQNTSPLWTFACSVLFFGKQYNGAAYWSLIPVCLGGALTAWGEASAFAWLGVIMSLSASLLRALRGCVQSTLMNGKAPIDSITLIFYATPFNMVIFLLGSAIFEGEAPWREIRDVSSEGVLWIFTASMFAALFNLFGFLLVGQLGAVGSMVIGNLKTPTTIVTCYLIFGNQISSIQVLGFSVAAIGAYIYTVHGKEEDKELQIYMPVEKLQLDDNQRDLEAGGHNVLINNQHGACSPSPSDEVTVFHAGNVGGPTPKKFASRNAARISNTTTTAGGNTSTSSSSSSSDEGGLGASSDKGSIDEESVPATEHEDEDGRAEESAPLNGNRDINGDQRNTNTNGPTNYHATGSTWMVV
ncbi:unnamed protein product [Amoebophrya sp. A120]|nr:unnamed protein product [Amoebophrya sp. A120]|eukprot:GSA120T00003235001.1